MMEPLITIRRMRPEDAAAVGAIERENFSEPWPETEFAKAAEHPDYIYLVAADKDRIVGYAGCTAAGGEADITNIAVASPYRQLGIGKKLLAVMIDLLKQRETDWLFLEVRVSNEPARSLYDRMGFEQVGRRKAFYRKPVEDALLMRKRIEPKG